MKLKRSQGFSAAMRQY